MKKKVIIITVAVLSIIITASIITAVIIVNNKNKKEKELNDELEMAKNTVKEYFSYIEQEEYEKMYEIVNIKGEFSKEDFLKRNKNIYEGIRVSNIEIEIETIEKIDDTMQIKYKNKMNTRAGNLEFSNFVKLIKNEDKKYKIEWSSNLIFPELEDEYKVRVSAIEGIRGKILDRNGNILAEEGTISNIGIVPGKLGENKAENINKISSLLGITEDSINSMLEQSWVREDTFVPIKKIPYDSTELKDQLLKISGVMIKNENARVYPYKEAMSHVTGYIQGINAEELEKNKDKGYNSSSVIGKDGVEQVYEDRLRATDGVKIYIENAEGNLVKTIAETTAINGEDIKLTIDAQMQVELYEKTKENSGFFVVMNSKTGELLALVSTPSYDANKFVLGMSNEEWNSITNNEEKPLFTRFLASWCPGSTFKPVTGAIGLSSGKLSEEDEFNYSGLAWQKDDSWKDHKITTLTPYNGKKNLRNAIIFSDNIYFARAAMQIGSETFTSELDKLKFNEDIKFDLRTSKSQYSNSESISSESILADSGYGQGEILVNPIHMASIYSAFANEGNLIKPYLEYKENSTPEYLVENAFSKEIADTIKEALIQVVENPSGTGHDVKVTGVTIAGKTGTAELKASKTATGDTLGWFNCFTTDRAEGDILIVSMVKNQSSRYLKQIIKNMF